MTTLFQLVAERIGGDRQRRRGELLARWYAEDGDADGIPARATAIDETDATIEIAGTTALPERGELELICGEPSFRVRFPAMIRIQHELSGQGRREATIAFERGLGADLLQKLAVGGLIDRRSYLRTPISLACEARPVDGPERPMHVRVHDFSPDGVRAASAEPLPVGTQLFLTAEGACPLGGGSLTLRVARVTPAADQWHLGCVFETRAGYFRFKSLLADDEAEPTLRQGRDWSWLLSRA